jgi:GNAT superfamily N-acetyltransferase
MKDDRVQQFDWKDLNTATDRFVIITILNRPGARLFGVKLEYEHYPPRTSKNDEYQYGIGKWQELMVIAISIPIKDRSIAEAVAAELGMNLTKEAVVMLVGGSPLEQFPAVGDHISHLQGEYKGDEDAALDAIFGADQPHRKEFIMTRIRVVRTDSKFVMDWAKSLKIYPLLHAQLLATQPEILHVIAAVLDRDAFGFVTICQKPGGFPYMGLLYVDDEVRRLGIGSLLVAAAIDICASDNLVPFKIDSRSKILDRITSNFPEDSSDFVHVNHLNNDLFVEQETVGSVSNARR